MISTKLTVTINFDDRGIVILKNSGNRNLNMINVLWKKNFALLFKNYHDVLTNGIWSE